MRNYSLGRFGDTPTPTTTATGGKAWTTIDKILSAGEKASGIISTVKNSGGSQTSTLPTTINVTTPGAQPPAEDNTTRNILIAVAGAAVVGGVVFAVTRKKKKKE
jgi:LPXTG-motif cell wall-anchored protein